MKKLLLASLVMLMPGLALAQTVPTVAQCSADVGVWHQTNANIAGYDSLPSTELVRRQQEMLQCADAVGASNISKYAEYMDVAYDYEAVREDRYYKFLERHNLLRQFYSEDREASIKRRK
jgi:hypothetical protein